MLVFIDGCIVQSHPHLETLMADELKIDPPVQNTAPVESAPKAQPSEDFRAKYEESQAKIRALEADQEVAWKLADPQAATDEKIYALRTMLTKRLGAERRSEIEAHIRELTGEGAQEEAPEERPRGKGRPKGTEGEEDPDELGSIRSELKALQESQVQQVKEKISSQFTMGLKAAMEGSQLAEIQKTIREVKGGEQAREFMANAFEDIQASAKQLIARELDNGARYSESLMQRAIASATAHHAKKYASVIGATGGLGRASETESELDYFEPKNRPSGPKPGMSRADQEAAIKDLTSFELISTLKNTPNAFS